MPEYEIQADCPIVSYEGKDEFEARQKYAENFRVNIRYLIATENAPQDIDVEASLNFAQQLKAEILPLAKSIRICIKERKYQYAINRIDDILAKLSAI